MRLICWTYYPALGLKGIDVHYYQFNIADYRKDTMHLTPIEHYIYRALMDTYYLSETPLTLDHAELMRTHCLRNADDMQALCAVLKDFFIMDETGYTHKRCDIEIEAFHTKSKSASESAKARWDRVRCERIAHAVQSQCEGNANHKPLTKNQDIKHLADKSADAPKKSPSKPKTSTAMPEGFEAFWQKYPRKVAKPQAIKSWRKINPDEQTQARIISAVCGARMSTAWLSDGGQYIPHPATYLNQRRWEDGMAEPAESMPGDGRYDAFMRKQAGLSA